MGPVFCAEGLQERTLMMIGCVQQMAVVESTSRPTTDAGISGRSGRQTRFAEVQITGVRTGSAACASGEHSCSEQQNLKTVEQTNHGGAKPLHTQNQSGNLFAG